jgi:hypothetical protein
MMNQAKQVVLAVLMHCGLDGPNVVPTGPF